jgi:phospholipid-transporting ATPase
MALCNTVMCETPDSQSGKTGKKRGIVYKASSPDELALTNAANSVGIELISREHNRLKIYNHALKQYKEFKVIVEFPFDSVRKRMSVIIKDLQSGSYMILCKGADSVMMDRINFDKNGIPGLRDIVNEDLYQYSCDGLRTLVFA